MRSLKSITKPVCLQLEMRKKGTPTAPGCVLQRVSFVRFCQESAGYDVHSPDLLFSSKLQEVHLSYSITFSLSMPRLNMQAMSPSPTQDEHRRDCARVSNPGICPSTGQRLQPACRSFLQTFYPSFDTWHWRRTASYWILGDASSCQRSRQQQHEEHPPVLKYNSASMKAMHCQCVAHLANLLQ